MITNEKLLLQCKIVTGWTTEEINDKFLSINCSYWDALNVFKCAGRLPVDHEQKILNQFGFDAWKDLWSKGFTQSIVLQ